MRLIDADALKEKLQGWHNNINEEYDKGYNVGVKTAIALLDNAPTECEKYRSFCMAKQRPQGEWILDWRDDLDAMSKRGWKCSCCSWRTSYGTPRFCMNCGAEMRTGGAE